MVNEEDKVEVEFSKVEDVNLFKDFFKLDLEEKPMSDYLSLNKNFSENAYWLLDQRYFCKRYGLSVFEKLVGKDVKEAEEANEIAEGKECSFFELSRRVSRVLAAAEFIQNPNADLEWVKTVEANIFDDMMNKRFLFNSPCLFSAGLKIAHSSSWYSLYKNIDEVTKEDYLKVNELKSENEQLFACFVINIEDDLESIFDSVKNAAIISKFGGGVGCNFSKLRENGALIKGGIAGKASGPVSFMETWNTMGSVVVQGGRRRAALMGILEDNHPDILEFINCKTEDGKLPYFNISVAVHKRLIRDVIDNPENAEYNLISRKDGSVVKKIKSKELWDEICKKAWSRGDPGIFFIENANEDSWLKNVESYQIRATNPCFKGNTKILTSEGYREIQDCVGEKIEIWNGTDWSTVKPRITGKNQEMLNIKFSNGSEVTCTLYHKFPTLEKGRVEARELEVGDTLQNFNLPLIKGPENDSLNNYMWCLGFYAGDGNYCRENEQGIIYLYGNKQNLLSEFSAFETSHRLEKNANRTVLSLSKETNWDKEFIPNANFSINDRLEYLAGILDADGTINSKEGSLSISSANLDYLNELKEMLDTLGCPTHVTKSRDARIKEMPNGDGFNGTSFYNCRAEYRLFISAWYAKYLRELGLNPRRLDLSNINPNRNCRRKVKITSITPAPKEEIVYCLNEPKYHLVLANGIITCQCGEQTLPDNTSCNLGSINIEAFVNEDGTFNFEEFEKQIVRSCYYLDLVIDASTYPLEIIKERTQRIRPIGLGIMGLANAAIKMKYKYSGPKFLRFSNEIAKRLGVFSLIAENNFNRNTGNYYKHHIGFMGEISDIFLEATKDTKYRSDNIIELIGKFEKEITTHSIDTYSLLDDRIAPFFAEPVPPSFRHTVTDLLSIVSKQNVTVDDIRQKIREKFVFSVISTFMIGHIRNSRRLSIAPTGSISMIFDTSAGIEPNFAWKWDRKIASTDGVSTITKTYYHNLIQGDIKKEYEETGKLPDYFETAYDVTPDKHVEILGIFSRYVDSAISKTVNLPNSATVEDIQNVYIKAFYNNCKGITIYRDGSRSSQPIEIKKDEPKKQEEEAPKVLVVNSDASRDYYINKVKARHNAIMHGLTVKDKTPWGSLFVTLNYDNDGPFETFISLGKSGSELKSMTEAIARLISIGLRSGCLLSDFIDTLKGISGKEMWMSETFTENENIIRSIPDAIGTLLEVLNGQEFIGNKPLKTETNTREESNRDDDKKKCPECGAPMELVNGCLYCYSCGYSPCK